MIEFIAGWNQSEKGVVQAATLFPISGIGGILQAWVFYSNKKLKQLHHYHALSIMIRSWTSSCSGLDCTIQVRWNCQTNIERTGARRILHKWFSMSKIAKWQHRFKLQNKFPFHSRTTHGQLHHEVSRAHWHRDSTSEMFSWIDYEERMFHRSNVACWKNSVSSGDE